MVFLKDVALTRRTLGNVTRVETTSHRVREDVSQEAFGDAVSIFRLRRVRLCTSRHFFWGRDADTELVWLRVTRTRVVFQVCAIGPYAGRFLVRKPKAAVVKTITTSVLSYTASLSMR